MYLEKWLPKHWPVIIAEIGVNHNGDLYLAKQMVDAAKSSGADIAKFQTFVTDDLVGRKVRLADYQARNIGRGISQYEMIKALELSREETMEIAQYCRSRGIEFLSSVGEHASVDFLCDIGVSAIKVGSGDLTNFPLLRHIAVTGTSVLLSTGMATLGEVELAVTTLENNGCRDIVLLHCTSDYPARYTEVNLRSMRTLETAFGRPVGYSDHTEGYEIALGATALGAVVIEKHFTLDKALPGPDHRASATPDEFRVMVQSIRNLVAGLGDGRKMPTASEVSMRSRVRKTLVARQRIPAGAILVPEMMSAMRLGAGLPPVMESILIGARTKRAVDKGEPLTLDMFDFSEPGRTHD